MSVLGERSSTQTRPVHVEIRPRDNYQHHVTVETPGDIISWSFFTRRKNIAFGLFFLHTRRSDSPMASPAKLPGPETLLRVGKSCSGDSLGRFDGHEQSSRGSASSSNSDPSDQFSIKDVILASRSSLHVIPASSPKPGHGSTSIPSSRANSVINPSNSLSGMPQTNADESFAERSTLLRARTIDSRPAGLEVLSKQNASLPDLRILPIPTSISAPNATEYLEILPVERYESFESTVSGHYQAPISGTYVFYFDNSYSFNTSKELFLNITVGPTAPVSTEAFSGWLLKKKQRRLQGWARRWFQLDRKGVLSYFEDRFSPCRGSIDLHHSTITKTPQRLMITLDSGRETFHLRALNMEDYNKWSEQFNLNRNQSVESLP